MVSMIHRQALGFCVAFVCLCCFPVSAQAESSVETSTRHALARFGAPAFGPDFTHFPYVNPDAPKGGRLRLAAQGSFDSLNPLILRGVWPRAVGITRDTLMEASGNELDVAYGLIAEHVTVPDDYSWIIFHLHPDARFQDGHPITAEDFVFAWDSIQAYGRPFLRAFLTEVASVEALGPHRLKATFSTRGDVKPLLNLATTLSPEPRHWWQAEGRDISKTTLEPILGSSAYRVESVDAGRRVTLARVEDYWARDLPVTRGRDNFDIITVDYFRDETVMFEAFKGDAYDFRVEHRAQRWATGYRGLDALDDGRMVKRAVSHQQPLGAQGFRFNTRRAKFSDPRVRAALGHLFDFEWTQRNILYGQYKRVKSNFPNSDFGANGPPTAAEQEILQAYADRLPTEVLTEAYEPPSGSMRAGLRTATRLFRAAGWVYRGRQLVNERTGEPLTIEFLSLSPAFERIILPFIQNLERAGVSASLRLVDPAQYEVRTNEFDFDIVVVNFNFFPPPGPELRSYYGSNAADVQGSANYSGIKDPVVDDLIERIIAAQDLDQIKLLSRCLDRVLLWGHYMIPQWYNDEIWLAHWDRFAWPERNPAYILEFLNTNVPRRWWVK